MNSPLTALLGALAGSLTTLAVLDAIPGLALVLQGGAVGTAVGTAIAMRADRRFGPDADRRFKTIARCSFFGAGITALIAIVYAVVQAA